MRQPGNEVVLDRSVLLNTLIKRKAISWTNLRRSRKVLPPNVRLVAVRPQVNAQDGLFLDMTGRRRCARTGDRLHRQTRRLRSLWLYRRQRLHAPPQTNPFYRYRLSVNYAQKL